MRSEIHKLDIIDDSFGLEELETLQRNENRDMLLRDLKWRDGMLFQRSRCKWIREGDINFKFFHGYINRRRKRNEILGVQINGEWKEEVAEDKIGIFEHFRGHFRQDFWHRPTIDQNFSRKKNSDQDNDMLISSFTEEEIKEAVWLCGSSKSPMPDEFNFRFFKKFWHAIRADLLKMMEEFHINEKLSEGLIRLLLCYYRKKRWQQIEILHAYFLDWRNLPDNIQNIGEQIK